MDVRIEYVDGTAAEGTAEDWVELRADGVDRVVVDGISFAGQSVYWLRREAGGWSVGAASFYPNPIVEVAIIDGVQQERHPEHVPDLMHDEVKLGWWWVR